MNDYKQELEVEFEYLSNVVHRWKCCRSTIFYPSKYQQLLGVSVNILHVFGDKYSNSTDIVHDIGIEIIVGR